MLCASAFLQCCLTVFPYPHFAIYPSHLKEIKTHKKDSVLGYLEFLLAVELLSLRFPSSPFCQGAKVQVKLDHGYFAYFHTATWEGDSSFICEVMNMM